MESFSKNAHRNLEENFGEVPGRCGSARSILTYLGRFGSARSILTYLGLVRYRHPSLTS